VNHEESGTRRKTILLVDDETAIRQFLRLALAGEQYEVLEAANGREALTVALRHVGSIDLLLTDVVMPELNGCELVEGLKTMHPEMKVLYMSGYAAGDSVWQFQPSDGSALIEKPFELNALIEMIRGMFRRPSNQSWLGPASGSVKGAKAE
jgi:two-component system cell cycle sensor histidine kinase/response regulator CckA